MRDQLLPLAVSEAEYAQLEGRHGRRRRRTALPVPAFVARRRASAPATTRRLDTAARAARRRAVRRRRRFQTDLAELSGLDRYETITWRIVTQRRGRPRACWCEAAPKPYAPPFLMLGPQPREHHVERLPHHPDRPLSGVTTCSAPAPNCASTARSARIPGLAIELYKPLGPTPFFVAPYAGIARRHVQCHRRTMRSSRVTARR